MSLPNPPLNEYYKDKYAPDLEKRNVPTIDESVFMLVTNFSDRTAYPFNNAANFTNTINPPLQGAKEIALARILIPVKVPDSATEADILKNFLFFIYMDNINQVHVGNQSVNVLNIASLADMGNTISMYLDVQYQITNMNWVEVINTIDVVTINVANIDGDDHPFIISDSPTYLVMKYR